MSNRLWNALVIRVNDFIKSECHILTEEPSQPAKDEYDNAIKYITGITSLFNSFLVVYIYFNKSDY